MNISSHVQYCMCPSCWFTLARSALPPREFVERAKSYHLTQKQHEIVAGIVEREKLEHWNEWAKG
jgi:hypothetical protein